MTEKKSSQDLVLAWPLLATVVNLGSLCVHSLVLELVYGSFALLSATISLCLLGQKVELFCDMPTLT